MAALSLKIHEMCGLAQVAEKASQIFDLYALQGRSAREVARSLGVSLTRVYVTQHRIAALLRTEILRLQSAEK